MRNSLQFIGGILVGFGLATFCVALWIGWVMHGMFMMGISNWSRLLVVMVLPMLMILLGIAFALAGRNRKNLS